MRAPRSTTHRRAALVISGGGSKGAFAVGAVEELYRRHRSTGWFDIVGGTSTGALIAPLAAMLAAPPDVAEEALGVLVQDYGSTRTQEVLRKQRIVDFAKRRDCLNGTAPLHELVHRRFRPEWFSWLASDRAPECYVVYTNYNTGRKVSVSPRDPGMDRERFMAAMIASASVPVIMEGVPIDGEMCYDGGLRDVLPLDDAIERGAEVVVPIFLDPPEIEASSSAFRRLDQVLFRSVSILMAETVKNDYELARMVSLGVRAREQILHALRRNPLALRAVRRVLDQPELADLLGADKRVVQIVQGLRPERTITERYLTFEPREMRQWIEWGRRRAREAVAESPFARDVRYAS